MDSTWQNYTVAIGKLDPGYQIKIYGECKSLYHGSTYKDMELDNFRFVDCDAQTQYKPTDLSCDFETDMCGWFDWNSGLIKQIDWVGLPSQLIVI